MECVELRQTSILDNIYLFIYLIIYLFIRGLFSSILLVCFSTKSLSQRFQFLEAPHKRSRIYLFIYFQLTGNTGFTKHCFIPNQIGLN